MKPCMSAISSTDGLDGLRRRYVASAEDEQLLQEERNKLALGLKLRDLREAAGLSQRELARRVGTSAAAICRLEDASYEGHSLRLLRRVAAALGQRLEVSFVPVNASEEAA